MQSRQSDALLCSLTNLSFPGADTKMSASVSDVLFHGVVDALVLNLH